MTVKEMEENAMKILRNINMVKGVLRRRNTSCGDSYTSHIENQQSPQQHKRSLSFRMPTSKHAHLTHTEIKTENPHHPPLSPTIGVRRNISVARMTDAFHGLHQKIVPRTQNGYDEIEPPGTEEKLVRFEVSQKSSSQVSKKINMFNRVLKSSSSLKESPRVKHKDENNNSNNKKNCNGNSIFSNNNNHKNSYRIHRNISTKRTKNDVTSLQTGNDTLSANVVVQSRNGKNLTIDGDFSTEELMIIRKKRIIGRSNSAAIPLREVVMQREVARTRRSLSFSLIPEEDTLSLQEAVERRLNLSKETNLCNTYL